MSIGPSISSSISSSIGPSFGDDNLKLLFQNNLQSSLVPQVAKGSATPTFTRATIKHIWGFASGAVTGAAPVLLALASGEAGFVGARRISEDVWSKQLSDGADINLVNTSNASLYLDADGPFGYSSESGATNVCLHNRDQTNVAWVKTTMTPLKDEIGIDGVANAASSLLATGANSTSLQTFTIGSTAEAVSFHLKRLTGTGTVQITIDNGVTWVTKTLTSEYQRFFTSQTLANPVVGIRIVTSGDKIAIDYGQLETGTFPSSEIETAGSSVQRNADVLTYPDAGNISDAAGTAICDISTDWSASTGTTHVALGRGTPTNTVFVSRSGVPVASTARDATNISNAPDGSTAFKTPLTAAASWGIALTAYWDGVPDATPASYVGTYGTGDLAIGATTSGSSPWGGTIRNVKIYGTEGATL